MAVMSKENSVFESVEPLHKKKPMGWLKRTDTEENMKTKAWSASLSDGSSLSLLFFGR